MRYKRSYYCRDWRGVPSAAIKKLVVTLSYYIAERAFLCKIKECGEFTWSVDLESAGFLIIFAAAQKYDQTIGVVERRSTVGQSGNFIYRCGRWVARSGFVNLYR